MTKIKICGLTRKEDIEYVNKLCPDYIGFVFAKGRRMVTVERAKELMDLLNKKIETVGVFVNEDIEKIKYTAQYLKLNIIQLHGTEDEQYMERLKAFRIWKAVGISTDSNSNNENVLPGIQTISPYTEGILLDSITKGIQGGTGISFNWNIIKKIHIDKPIILAGGLNPENVLKAVEEVKPYAVDVSSGVEVDGVKDFNKINKFIKKVRKAG